MVHTKEENNLETTARLRLDKSIYTIKEHSKGQTQRENAKPTNRALFRMCDDRRARQVAGS